MKPIALTVALLAVLFSQAQLERYFRPLVDPGLLRYEGVRKALGLSKIQNGKIMASFLEMRRIGASQERWPGSRVKAEERLRFEAMNKRNENRELTAKTLDSKLVDVLSAAQKSRLRELKIQSSKGTIALHPEVVKAIGTTKAQMKLLNELQLKEMRTSRRLGKSETKSAYELRMKTWHEAAHNVLTASQKNKLVSMMGKRVETKKLLTGFFPPMP